MRAFHAMALLAVAGIAVTTACTGRGHETSPPTPGISPVPTLGAGDVIPWADIPAPLPTHAQPAIPPLAATLTTPASVRAGDDLKYEVTLRNMGDTTYRWTSECPVFLAILQTPPPEPRNVAGNHQQLNCGPARDLPPGGEVRFEMRLFVPREVPAGPWVLIWSFTKPGLPASPPATANLTIQR